MSDSSASTRNSAYSFRERVLIGQEEADHGSSTTTIRLEFLAEWDTNVGRIHPFTRLQQRLFPKSTSDDSYSSSSNLDVWIQISSRAKSDFPSNSLNVVPTLSDRLIHGPSGFWIHLDVAENVDSATIQEWMQMWVQQRLITTPISNVPWDNIVSNKKNVNKRQQQQLILPNNGQGWSADALQQSFQSLNLGRQQQETTASFMGRSAMDWSNLLVSTNAQGKAMWWHLQQQDDHQYSLNFGLEYTIAAADMAEQVYWQALVSNFSPSPLGPRKVYRVLMVPDATPSDDSYQLQPILSPEEITKTATAPVPQTPRLKVEQVLRRPWMDRGRLETWIEMPPGDAIQQNYCNDSILYRQVIPPFLTPSWQTLQTGSTSHDAQSSVEWLEDGTSILQVTWKNLPDSSSPLIVSLEYTPSFLTMDDFPGDPNRGRELPPAVVTCLGDNHNAVSVYSSSMLILPPVPDMSMPFNVLSLTCSLYAYLIGTLLIVLTKKGSESIRYRLYPDQRPKSKLEKLKEKMKALKKRILSKLQKQPDANDAVTAASGNDGEETNNESSNESLSRETTDHTEGGENETTDNAVREAAS